MKPVKERKEHDKQLRGEVGCVGESDSATVGGGDSLAHHGKPSPPPAFIASHP